MIVLVVINNAKGAAMELRYSPFDFTVHEDPYPFYARLREEAPVYHNEQDGFWALSRHADVLAAFRDDRRFSSRNGIRIEEPFWGPQAEQFFSFVAMDPPKHTRMRGLVNKVFTPRRVAALEPRLLEIARTHLEPLLDGDEFDLIDFAKTYPTDVISELVGVPESDRAQVRDISFAVMHAPEEGDGEMHEGSTDAMGALIGYYAQLTAERAKKPQEDLLSGLLQATENDDRLTPEEIIGILILLIGAGSETTMLLLGNAWHAAWKHPAERERAFAGRIEDWVEETLRYDPVSQSSPRVTTEDVELHGVTIPAGAKVLLLSGAANRDPEVFPDPDRFDLDRDTRQHLTFGNGRHHCLGAPLARLEAKLALKELVATVADYEIDETAAKRVHTSINRGFISLPTKVTARR